MINGILKRFKFEWVAIICCLLIFVGCTSNSSLSYSVRGDSKEPMDAEDWVSRVNWRADCGDEAFYEGGVLPSVEVFALDGIQLIKVVCTNGMYQPIQVLYVISDDAQKDGLQCKKLPQIQASDSNAAQPYERYSDCLINAAVTVDDGRKELTIFQRYRGVGGCGHKVRYTLIDNTFSPVEIKAKSECDEDITPVELWNSYTHKEYQAWPEVGSPWHY